MDPEIVIVGDRLSEAVLDAEISSVKLKDRVPLRVGKGVRVCERVTVPLIVDERELVCSSVRVWDALGVSVRTADLESVSVKVGVFGDTELDLEAETSSEAERDGKLILSVVVGVGVAVGVPA